MKKPKPGDRRVVAVTHTQHEGSRTLYIAPDIDQDNTNKVLLNQCPDVPLQDTDIVVLEMTDLRTEDDTWPLWRIVNEEENTMKLNTS